MFVPRRTLLSRKHRRQSYGHSVPQGIVPLKPHEQQELTALVKNDSRPLTVPWKLYDNVDVRQLNDYVGQFIGQARREDQQVLRNALEDLFKNGQFLLNGIFDKTVGFAAPRVYRFLMENLDKLKHDGGQRAKYEQAASEPARSTSPDGRQVSPTFKNPRI